MLNLHYTILILFSALWATISLLFGTNVEEVPKSPREKMLVILGFHCEGVKEPKFLSISFCIVSLWFKLRFSKVKGGRN